MISGWILFGEIWSCGDILKGNLCDVLKRNRRWITETEQTVEIHEYSQRCGFTNIWRKEACFWIARWTTIFRAFLRQSRTRKQRLELFSYKAVYIVAREKQPHVDGEIAIKPVLESFVEILQGEVFQKTVRDAITGVALGNNTITRRIKNMGRIWENRFTTIFVLHLTQRWPLTSSLILRQKHSC